MVDATKAGKAIEEAFSLHGSFEFGAFNDVIFTVNAT